MSAERSTLNGAELLHHLKVMKNYKAPSSVKLLRQVQAPDGFFYASADPRYGHPFGRDALEIDEDIVEFRPNTVERSLLALATLQGTEENKPTQEKPGKLPHEKLMKYYATPDGSQGKKNDDQAAILKTVAKEWGISKSDEEAEALDELVVYYNSDTTQMYVNMVAKLCQVRGNKDFLNKTFINKDGEERTIRQSIEAGMAFLEAERKSSPRGYVEFHEPQPASHRNNYWKDGFDSVLHADGSLPNYKAPIASLVVQGLTAKAYESAAYLFEEDRERSIKYRNEATSLRARVISDFWMEDDEFFTMGLDRDPRDPSQYRYLAPASDAGAVLRTGLLDDLSDEEQRRYLEPIAKRLFSKDFWVDDAGIVCMSRSVPKEDPAYIGYELQNAVWIKENHDIARGFDQYGLSGLADLIDVQMINLMNMAGKNIEFAIVTDDGKVVYDYDRKNPRPSLVDRQVIAAASIPLGQQGWSGSAGFEVKMRRWQKKNMKQPEMTGWRKTLYESIASQMTSVPALLDTKEKIVAGLPTDYAFAIDQAEGKRKGAETRQHLTAEATS